MSDGLGMPPEVFATVGGPSSIPTNLRVAVEGSYISPPFPLRVFGRLWLGRFVKPSHVRAGQDRPVGPETTWALFEPSDGSLAALFLPPAMPAIAPSVPEFVIPRVPRRSLSEVRHGRIEFDAAAHALCVEFFEGAAPDSARVEKLGSAMAVAFRAEEVAAFHGAFEEFFTWLGTS